MESNQSLSKKLLTAASSLDPFDLENFYRSLLASKIFIPVKPKLDERKGPVILGEKEVEELPYLFSESDQQNLLAIFSEENFLSSWAERELNFIEEKFTSLLWHLPPNTWLHLNPGQDIGKEFSPVEVELLKQGNSALADLVALAQEEEQEDFEIELPPDELLKLKPALLPLLELYSELKEGFLLSIKESHAKQARALIGLHYSPDLSQDKKDYLRNEIERTAQEFLSPPFTGVFIVDDLSNPKSPNQTLFLDFKPFYSKK